MFPWYVNAGLILLVAAGFWGIWACSGSSSQ